MQPHISVQQTEDSECFSTQILSSSLAILWLHPNNRSTWFHPKTFIFYFTDYQQSSQQISWPSTNDLKITLDEGTAHPFGLLFLVSGGTSALCKFIEETSTGSSDLLFPMSLAFSFGKKMVSSTFVDSGASTESPRKPIIHYRSFQPLNAPRKALSILNRPRHATIFSVHRRRWKTASNSLWIFWVVSNPEGLLMPRGFPIL